MHHGKWTPGAARCPLAAGGGEEPLPMQPAVRGGDGGVVGPRMVYIRAGAEIEKCAILTGGQAKSHTAPCAERERESRQRCYMIEGLREDSKRRRAARDHVRIQMVTEIQPDPEQTISPVQSQAVTGTETNQVLMMWRWKGKEIQTSPRGVKRLAEAV